MMLFGTQTMVLTEQGELPTLQELAGSPLRNVACGEGVYKELRLVKHDDVSLLDMCMESGHHRIRVSQNCGGLEPVVLPPLQENSLREGAAIVALLDVIRMMGGRIWVEGQDEKREIHVVTKHDLRLELARQVNAAYGTSSTKLLNSLRLRGQASRWYATSICDAHARTSLETAFTYFHTVRKYLTSSSKLLNLPNTNELERLATLAYMFGYSMVATRRPSYSLWGSQSVSLLFKPNACKRSETFYHRYDIDRGPTAAYAIDLDSPTIVANGFLIQR